MISATLGLVVSGLSLATAAWFGGRGSIGTIDDLGGSVLRSYFHSGTGSENDPFTITTPWHYENFAKLHYTMEGFAEKGYYFEFGYPLRGGSTRYFYGTDENGVVNYSVTNATTLNLGGDSFEPIGNEEKPFIGNLNGNNLTVTNFEIDGSGHHDIGIFGYIGEKSDGVGAKIDNAYFSDFTVNTKGATKTDKHDDVGSRVHSENAHVGYIAGHVVRATDINNVYVNNCTIDGKTAKDRVVDTYGYYGKVEYDHTDGQRQTGDNYSFDLSASKIYNAINSNYASIRDNPLRTRIGKDDDDMGRHYADYDFPIPGEPEWVNNRAAHPLSEAITRVNGQTYRLNGTTTDEYADRTYSLSTVGYQPLTGDIRNEYEVKQGPDDFYPVTVIQEMWPAGQNTEYYVKNGNEYVLATSFTPSTQYYINKAIRNNTTITRDGEPLAQRYSDGDYFRYDTTDQVWKYVHSRNDDTTWIDQRDIPISYNYPSSILIDLPGQIGIFNQINLHNVRAYFTVDGQIIKNGDNDYFPGNCNVSRADDSRGRSRYGCQVTNLVINNLPSTLPLYRGVHHISFTIFIYTDRQYSRYMSIRLANTTLTNSGIMSNDFYLTQTAPVELTQDAYGNYDPLQLNISTSAVQDYLNDYGNVAFHLNDQKGFIPDTDIPPFEPVASFEIPLDGKNMTAGESEFSPLKSSTIENFEKQTFTETIYDEDGNPHEVTREAWVASDNPTRSPDYDADPVFISDAQSLIDNNYKFKNIDIVGGNVTFYYLGTILFFPVNLEVITLPPETQNTNIVELPEMSDLDAMSQFYATKYCPGSIVMYVNNSGNPLDTVDSQLGHVEFTYANMNIQGRTLINVTRPSFKKGNGNFVNVETLGRIEEGEQYVNFVSTFDGDITESGARKTSYVCLDSQGRMLGIYDLNGNPGYGFFKAATTEPAEERYRHVTYNPGTTQYDQNPYGTYEKDPSGSYVLNKDRVSNIATYVIVLGSSSRSSTNGTYITDVKFSYKAHEGSGGSFGPVGYRDARDTVTDTILNFFFDAPAELNYSIKVYFNKNDSIYYITFSASGQITINIFNYEIDNYSIYFNGSLLADDKGNNIEVNVVNYDPGG